VRKHYNSERRTWRGRSYKKGGELVKDMKEDHQFRVKPGGAIETPYDDDLVDLVKDMGAKLTKVRRASNIEFETIGELSGWSVRATHDPELAIRLLPSLLGWELSRSGNILLFETREEALAEEMRFFWQLIPPKEETDAH
jgi:hypothetical protein